MSVTVIVVGGRAGFTVEVRYVTGKTFDPLSNGWSNGRPSPDEIFASEEAK